MRACRKELGHEDTKVAALAKRRKNERYQVRQPQKNAATEPHRNDVDAGKCHCDHWDSCDSLTATERQIRKIIPCLT